MFYTCIIIVDIYLNIYLNINVYDIIAILMEVLCIAV